MDYVESKRANIKKGIALRTNLYAEYLFDGDTTDTSGNGRDATNSGGVAAKDRFNRASKSMEFDGLEGATVIYPTELTSYTVCGWVNSTSVIELIDNSYDNSNSDTYGSTAIALVSSIQIRFIYDKYNGSTYGGGYLTGIFKGWIFIAMSVNSSAGVVKCYVNNIDVTENLTYGSSYQDNMSRAQPLKNAYNTYFGYKLNKGAGTVKGKLSNIRIYNKILTELEINNLYYEIASTGETLLESGLVAHYKLDGNANDSGNNGYNGTNYGAVATTNRFGQSGKAMLYDGVDAISVILPTDIPIFSVCGWVYIDFSSPELFSLINNNNNYSATNSYGSTTISISRLLFSHLPTSHNCQSCVWAILLK